MIRKYITRFAAVCITGFVLSGCAAGQEEAVHSIAETSTTAALSSGEESTGSSEAGSQESSQESSQNSSGGSSPEEASLPEFTYIGDDPVRAGICAYFISENEKRKDREYYDDVYGELYMPVPVILKTEELDEEVLVYGTFWDFWYERQGDNLFTTNGGANTGRIRMRREGSALIVGEFEEVRDGGDYVVDLKRICGEDTDLYDSFFTKEEREDRREQIRANMITQYVDEHELPINSYQDSGWEPVWLMTKLNTAFPSLGVRVSLPKNRGWIGKPEYRMYDENTAQVSYRDQFLDADMTLRAGSGDAQSLVGFPLTFTEEGRETWSTNNAENGKYMEIDIRYAVSDEEESYIFAEWDLFGLHFVLWGNRVNDNGEKIDSSTFAKAASYVAGYSTTVQEEQP